MIAKILPSVCWMQWQLWQKNIPKERTIKLSLDTLAKEGLGNTVFIADLEDACQSGDSLAMEKEAARVQWVSENGLAGLDCTY